MTPNLLALNLVQITCFPCAVERWVNLPENLPHIMRKALRIERESPPPPPPTQKKDINKIKSNSNFFEYYAMPMVVIDQAQEEEDMLMVYILVDVLIVFWDLKISNILCSQGPL